MPQWRERTTARRHAEAASEALGRGDTRTAEKEWLDAIVAWPDDADAYAQLGDLYRSEGDIEVAGVCYLKVLRIAPRFPHVYCRLAQGALESGDLTDARRYARSELGRDPQCAPAASVLLAAGSDSAAPPSGRASSSNPSANPGSNPSDEPILTVYAETFMDTDPGRVIRILAGAQKRYPASAEIAFDLGRSYAKISADPKTVSMAIAQLRRAERLAPGEGLVHTELCRILLQQNRVAEAVQEGALAFADSPGDVQACFQYGQSLSRAHRKAEAAQMQRRVEELGAARDMQTRLRRKFSEHPGDPAVAHQLYSVDVTLGDTYDAYEVAKLAIRLHPGSAVAARDFRLLSNPSAPMVPGRLRVK